MIRIEQLAEAALNQDAFLLRSLTQDLCEQEAPEPLRKRGFYAPPNFLESA